jgi:ribose 5-phosphate isomerase B
MKVYVASDHAGFAYKNLIVALVRDLGHEAVDMGPDAFVPNDDYPERVRPAAEAVAADLKEGTESRAIILGGSGQGEAIVANRIPGVRAVVYYGGEQQIITLSREHNDANVLSLGARFVTESEVRWAVKQWLALPFSREVRHERRIRAIDTDLYD